MSVVDNRRRMEEIFAALAKGDGAPFVDALAEDCRWTLLGSTAWSGTYEGKREIQEKLLRPLFAQFADRYTNRAVRMIAEGDLVVVECRGSVTTKRGEPYENAYCWICRLADGKIREITEYCDTQLIVEALDGPR